MKFITFKQFIYTINISNCHYNNEGKTIDDNDIIRIHLDNDFNHDKDNYIDLGWYDMSSKLDSYNILEKYFNKNVLESVVTDFQYNDDINCIEV